MRVKIGPYINWFGPYQLAELLCFWAKEVPDEHGFKSKPEWVHKFGEWLAHGNAPDEDDKPQCLRRHKDRPETPLYKFLSWVHSKKKRKTSVKIDKWDTWSMDSTLAIIILPMLKQLKETKHGSGYIEMEDLPEHLQGTTTDEWSDQKTLDFYEEVPDNVPDVHKRYDWFLDELIWTFEQLQPDNDWEAQYHTGESDTYFEVAETYEDGKPKLWQWKTGPNDTRKWDKDGWTKHNDRIDNGLRLFGKYFRTLWD